MTGWLVLLWVVGSGVIAYHQLGSKSAWIWSAMMLIVSILLGAGVWFILLLFGLN